LVAQLNAWDKIIAKKASENPMFKKVLDSQKAFAQRAVRWDLLTNVDMKIAYDHYFKG
jgi:TRAP-type mannitol/chloroaromatic compound transport system substrate-binding protein